MTFDHDALRDHFAHERSMFVTSPLYQSLCPVVADSPRILELLKTARPGQQPSFLLFGAVHFLLLEGDEHPLRRFYPSTAGDAVADIRDVAPAFRDFCDEHRAALTALISTKLVQTNVVNRAVALRLALREVGRRERAPVHLIDVGTSAGTHLCFDRYRYELGDRVFGRSGVAGHLANRLAIRRGRARPRRHSRDRHPRRH